MRRVVVRHLVDTVLPSALAALAVAVALLAGHHPAVFLLAAAAVAVAVWPGRSKSATARTAPRLVAALAVVVGYASAVTMPDWPLLIAGTALVGLLQAETMVFRVGRPLYEVANLPVRAGVPGRVWNRRAASRANSALLAATLVFGLARWPTWPLLVGAIGAVAVTGGAVLAAVRLRLFGRARALATLRQGLSDYSPAFMVYFTGPAGSTYQLMMWLPQLKRLDRRFVVVLRERHAFDRAASAAGVPVVYAPEMSTLDACVVPGVKSVFYVNNGAKNTHCVRYRELAHIFLNHGDSDKPSSFNPVTAMYDRVFVAGQAGIDRYVTHGVEIPPHKFRIVGRPQVAPIRPPTQPVEQVAQPVVLYAPTWRGHYSDADYSSLPIATLIVRALLERGVTVILRHHPYSMTSRTDAAHLAAAHRLLAADAAATGRRHRFGPDATTDLSLIECINESDALITDVSSVASDYLYSGKPFAITDMVGHGTGVVEAFPLARVAYVIDASGTGLDDVLDRLLKADPRRAERLRARTHYLGDFPRDGYADAFVTEARRYL